MQEKNWFIFSLFFRDTDQDVKRQMIKQYIQETAQDLWNEGLMDYGDETLLWFIGVSLFHTNHSRQVWYLTEPYILLQHHHMLHRSFLCTMGLQYLLADRKNPAACLFYSRYPVQKFSSY